MSFTYADRSKSYYSEDRAYLRNIFTAAKINESPEKSGPISSFCGRVLELDARKDAMWVRLQGISDVNGETIKLRIGHDFLKDDSPPYTPVVGSYLISHDLTLDVASGEKHLEITGKSRLVALSDKIDFFHGPDYLTGRPVDYIDVNMNQITFEEQLLWTLIRRTPFTLKQSATTRRLTFASSISDLTKDVDYFTELMFNYENGEFRDPKAPKEWRTKFLPIHYLKNETINTRSGYTTFGIVKRMVHSNDTSLFLCLADPFFPENEIVLAITMTDFPASSWSSISYQEGDLVVIDIARLVKESASSGKSISNSKNIEYHSAKGNKLFSKWNSTIYCTKAPYSNKWLGVKGTSGFSRSIKLMEPIKQTALKQAITQLKNVYTPFSMNLFDPTFSICVRILAWPKDVGSRDITLAVTDYTANPLFPKYSTLVDKEIANKQPYSIVSLFIPATLRNEVINTRMKEAEFVVFDCVKLVHSQNSVDTFYLKIDTTTSFKDGDFCRPAVPGNRIPQTSHVANHNIESSIMNSIPSPSVTKFHDDDDDDEEAPPQPTFYIPTSHSQEISSPIKGSDSPLRLVHKVTESLPPTSDQVLVTGSSLTNAPVTTTGSMSEVDPVPVAGPITVPGQADVSILKTLPVTNLPEMAQFITSPQKTCSPQSEKHNLPGPEVYSQKKRPRASESFDISINKIASQKPDLSNAALSNDKVEVPSKSINYSELIPVSDSESEDEGLDLNTNNKSLIRLCDNVFCHNTEDPTTIPSIIENGVEFGQTFKIVARIDQILPGKIKHFITADGEILFKLVISDITFSDKLEVIFHTKVGNAQPFLGMKTSTMIANPGLILKRLKTLKSDINTNIWFPLCIKAVPLSNDDPDGVQFLGCETQILL